MSRNWATRIGSPGPEFFWKAGQYSWFRTKCEVGAVPALKLSKSAKEIPLSSHLEALASHIVYGVSTESVRRGMRAALRNELLDTKAIRSGAREVKSAAIHWEVPTRGEVRRKISKAKATAREKLEQVA